MKNLFGVFLLALLALTISACGGGNQATGTKVTVTAVGLGGNPSLISAAAYQTGDGEWQQLLPDKDGVFSFYVPDGETRYGVAIRCGDNFPLGSAAAMNVFQFTTNETVSPVAHCMAIGELSSVSGEIDLSAVGGATRYEILVPGKSESDTVSSNDYEVYVPHGGSRDLIALAEDSSSNILAARIIRGIDASNAVVYKDIALNSSDALQTHNLAAFSVPSGMDGHFTLSLLTAGGSLYIDSGSGTRSEAGGPVYAIANAQHGDTYIVEISADSSSRNSSVLHHTYLDAPDLGSNISLSLNIAPFPAGSTITVAANPTFATNHPDANIDFYEFVTISPQALLRTYQVSTDWLGGKTSYTLPGLSSIPGFQKLHPAAGENVHWNSAAIKTSLTLKEYNTQPHAWVGFMAIPVKAGATLDLAGLWGEYTAP